MTPEDRVRNEEAVDRTVLDGRVGDDETDEAEAAARVESDLVQLQSERAELVDTLRRVQADFENYRKRMLREQTTLVERATERLVEDLLPVLDSFDGALGSVTGDSPELQKVRDGVEAIWILLKIRAGWWR